MSFSIQWNEATPEEDRASATNLALAPWVEERARKFRERHLAAKRAEPIELTQSKAAKWRRSQHEVG
jgi:hypothetical protein